MYTGWRVATRVFVVAFTVAVLLIPLAAAALGVATKQAMFWPMLTAMYTYLLRVTLGAAAAVGVLTTLIAVLVRFFKRTPR